MKFHPKRLLRSALFASLAAGAILAAVAVGLAPPRSTPSSFERMSAAQAWSDLESNRPVGHLIRLIAYDPQTEPWLAIDRLERLGPPDQLYSFVASYEEMAGYTAKQALEKNGLSLREGQHVSAVIFPQRTELYPANARGLLQIIRAVEQEKGAAIDERLLDGANALTAAEAEGLQATGSASYRVSDFRDLYPRYCELARRFNCGPAPYPASRFIGSLYHDWHPLGFSQIEPARDPCTLPAEQYCAFADWATARAEFLPKFGSRAFFTRNLEIATIPGRILIDFDRPDRQIIPYIGATAD
ncbi:MAG: hypothetical protein FD144_5598 [Rhodospirillaceae bacterium]|nr:MAG: hypothetical protein FD144_5598 [Rhodospirillaceae bacterium]